MVDVLMLASLGDTSLDELLALSQEYDVVRKERTQSFFSDRTIYDATAFTQTNAGGDETAYLGHVIVGPNGRLGFDPSVVLSGEVAGGSIHDFLAGEIAAGHDGETTLANLLSGDDVVVGHGGFPSADGYDGDDVLMNASYLIGGGGDDILFAKNSTYLVGGEGDDRFIIDRRVGSWYLQDVGVGADQILFDRDTYGDIGNRITKDSFHYGPTAADAEDRLIVYAFPNQIYSVFIDPDGVGGQTQQFIGYIRSDRQPTFRDFGLVDAAKLMPDIGDLFDRNVTPQAAFGPDRAGAHAGFAQDTTPLTHHGLIQLV